jgi:hypothetical protein
MSHLYLTPPVSSVIDKLAMADPFKQWVFQKQMVYVENKVMAIPAQRGVDIDTRYRTWCEGLRSTGAHVFGTERRRPQQPWMTDRSWDIVRHFRGVRRRAFRNHRWAIAFVRRTIFSRWLQVCNVRVAL